MRFATCLTALVLVLPALAVAQDRSRGPAENRDAALESTMLAAHNATRERYGSAPLTWNPALAARARLWAEELARSRGFRHDPQTGVRPREGENLSVGSRGAYGYDDLVALWVDEHADFTPGRFPEVSRSGNLAHVGHYTQMVWPTTREIGCAMASNADDDFLVCRYLPAGNVVGSVMRSARR